MNSLNYPGNIKRKLVKILFVVTLSLSPSFLTLSNPIIPPPVVFEIYFGPVSWEIEIMNNQFYSYIENFDDLWLVGQFDTAQFEPGHPFLPGVIEVATQFDMLTPMTIQQSGDHVSLCYKSGNYYEYLGGIAWGSFSPEVTAPVGEQSIAIQMFNLPENEWGSWEAKEQPHTINSNPGNVIKRTSFSGYVWDQNGQPMQDIYLDYCWGAYYFGSNPTVPIIYTNSDGYFHTDNMYSREFFIRFRNDFYGPIIGDTTVYLEIDSTNYFEFKLDTLLTGIKEHKPVVPAYSIYNIPNPSSSKTTFIIESDNANPNRKGVIKIYSEAGYIVDIFPLEISGGKQELIYNCHDKSLAAGLYFYNLEIGHQKVASGKMVISR